MILQINSQQSPAFERGGVHQVGEVVSLILTGLRTAEGQARTQILTSSSSQSHGTSATQATGVLA